MNTRTELLAGRRRLAQIGRKHPALPLRAHESAPIWGTDAEADAQLDDIVLAFHEADVDVVDDVQDGRRVVTARLDGYTYTAYRAVDMLAEVEARLPEDRETLTLALVMPPKLGIRSSDTSGPYAPLSPQALQQAPDAATAPVPDDEGEETPVEGAGVGSVAQSRPRTVADIVARLLRRTA